jgi:hypothetical protein
MKKTSNTKENLTWFLIAMSPTTFGVLVIAMITIFIGKYYGLNLNENGIIVLPIFFIYTFIWAKIYRKVTGRSWLD